MQRSHLSATKPTAHAVVGREGRLSAAEKAQRSQFGSYQMLDDMLDKPEARPKHQRRVGGRTEEAFKAESIGSKVSGEEEKEMPSV